MFSRLSRPGLLAALSIVLINSAAQGQLQVDDNVPADKKAIVAINIDVQQLYKNQLVKSLVDLGMKEAGPGAPFTPDEITKISAFVAAPKGMDPVSLSKINFYAYAGFNNQTATGKIKALMLAEEGREVTVGGKSLIAPPEDSGMYFDVQPNYIVAGTEDYLTSPSNQFSTKQLADTYSALPKSPVRIVIDLDGARELLDQVSEMAKANADIFTKPYVSLIDEVATIAITSDLDNDSILRIQLSGHNEDEAGKIKQKLDALIGLGKQLSESAPVGPSEQILLGAAKDVEAKQNGKSVTVEIKKPEGFEASVLKMLSTARKAAGYAQDMNNFKQVLLAMHNYHDTQREFPFAKHVAGEDSGKGLSWAVYLLPYMEESALYEAFDLDAAYDSPQNAKHGKTTISTLTLKSGGQIMWVRPTKVANKLSSILDGTSNTVAFVQSKKVSMEPWTKAQSITPAEVVTQFKALKDGEVMIFGMYDGSVRRISNREDVADIEAMLEPADGKAPQN